ncbi:tyrosine-protein phosphatase [Streptomyces sp. N2-109]|uniref:Tyrosine-protein phosphatase n=1 Tax=Streptomyces gossypii TaxID=2883101 RepID=A0ABT2JV29_9ACTN|nr:tyrosine-protein phosphatase [Streptomyces gossypii]MCT2591691.1 tyrosine-protein phosphatase [Streptomyces gossypii]
MTQDAVEPTLAGIRNFRDVGGLPAADGRRLRRRVLYRSGHLAHATSADVAFLSGLGLHTVFDFRNAADQALEGPDAVLDGTRNLNIPLTDPADGVEFWRMVRDGSLAQLRTALADGQAAGRMTDAYRTMIHGRTAEHSRVLHALAEDSVPALMHCAAGKDRAGVSVAVTLLAVGVGREAIETDYLKSNSPQHRYRVHRAEDAEGGLSSEVMALLAPLFDARPGYLAAAFAAIDERWGGTEGYLTEGLRLSGPTRELLRERLLD